MGLAILGPLILGEPSLPNSGHFLVDWACFHGRTVQFLAEPPDAFDRLGQTVGGQALAQAHSTTSIVFASG